MTVRFLSTTELELKAAMVFYESVQEGSGTDFLREVEAATRLIADHPLAWTPCHHAPDGVGRIGLHLGCFTRFVETKSSSSPSWICGAIPSVGSTTCSANPSALSLIQDHGTA